MIGTAWYIKFPADAYALGPVRFKEPVSESIVREYARKHFGYTRLPFDFSCWLASEEVCV